MVKRKTKPIRTVRVATRSVKLEEHDRDWYREAVRMEETRRCGGGRQVIRKPLGNS